LASFSIQQEATIWNAMLALCASKLNVGHWARNYIPFQGIAPYNLEENTTQAWVITGLRLSKQTGSMALAKGSTIYIGDYSKANDEKFPKVSSMFIILSNAIWQEPGCIIYGGQSVLNSHNICLPLLNPPPILITIPRIFTHHSNHFALYMKGSIGQRINLFRCREGTIHCFVHWVYVTFFFAQELLFCKWSFVLCIWYMDLRTLLCMHVSLHNSLIVIHTFTFLI
jgi:hypothetical protein